MNKHDKLIPDAQKFCTEWAPSHCQVQVIQFHLMQLRKIKKQVRAMKVDPITKGDHSYFHETVGANKAIDEILKLL